MVQSKVYVGNISYDTTGDDLTQLFSVYGNVVEVKLITDHATGRSKGFAFVTFETAEAANAAIAADGSELQNRRLKVSLARDKERTGGEGGGRSGGGRSGGFGGGRGGFGGGDRGGFGGGR
jgi:RNA recognition motif-containing protein